jgi:transcriptional regulator with XRE-family HTH domain
MSTGQTIRETRLRMELTQVELAEHLGVSQSTVAQWETDRKNPPKYIDLALTQLESDIAKDRKRRTPAQNAKLIMASLMSGRRGPKRPSVSESPGGPNQPGGNEHERPSRRTPRITGRMIDAVLAKNANWLGGGSTHEDRV